MKKKISVLLISVTLLLISSLLAYELSDFPAFINATNTLMVVGDSMNGEDVNGLVEIGESFLNYFKCPKGGMVPASESLGISVINSRCGLSAKLASEVSNISSHDLILVGGPCANSITAQVIGLPQTWPECATGFENGIGKIKVYNKWNKTQVIVAGLTAQDTRKAARVLATYQEFNLSGYKIEVSGEINNPNITEVIGEEEYCEKDEDCVLVISGCRHCASCKTYSITDSEVIAVNKNLYKCPPRPKDILCPGCSDIVAYNPIEDAICVDNKCEKREEWERQISDEELKSCSQDSDCIRVQVGCCPCTAGGGSKTINKKYAGYWDNKLLKECAGPTMCLTVINNGLSCTGDIKCITNQCAFVTK